MQDYLYDDLYNLEETHWWHKAKQKVLIELLTKFLSIKDPEILDVGCGTGKTLETLQKYGRSYGIDSSKLAISYCLKRGLKNVKVGSTHDIRFKSLRFDIVTMLDVLEHTDEKRTLSEVNRVLKKDGLLIITVPAHQSLWSQWDIVLHHKRRYSRKDLIAALNKNGFTVLKISYLYSFLLGPVMFVRFVKTLIFNEGYPSDFRVSFPLVNSLFGIMTRIERKVFNIVGLSAGTSLVCVAKKIS